MCCNVHGPIYGLMEPCFKGLWYENTARTDKHVTKISILVNQFSNLEIPNIGVFTICLWSFPVVLVFYN